MSTEPSQHNTEIGKLIPLLKEKNIGYSPAFEKAYDDFSEVVSAYNKKYEQKMTTALKMMWWRLICLQSLSSLKALANK